MSEQDEKSTVVIPDVRRVTLTEIGASTYAEEPCHERRIYIEHAGGMFTLVLLATPGEQPAVLRTAV